MTIEVKFTLGDKESFIQDWANIADKLDSVDMVKVFDEAIKKAEVLTDSKPRPYLLHPLKPSIEFAPAPKLPTLLTGWRVRYAYPDKVGQLHSQMIAREMLMQQLDKLHPSETKTDDDDS